MEPARNPIVLSYDMAEAASAAEPVVLVLDVDAPPLQKLASLPPTSDDVARAAVYGAFGQKQFFARRALLRHFLAARYHCAAADIVVGSQPSSEPTLLAPAQAAASFVSIAGRGAFAAFALAARPIGVDLEILGPAEEIPEAMLHKAERAKLLGLDGAARHEAFLKIWTLKEAYVKAQGVGLAREPSEIDVRLDADGGIELVDCGVRVPATAARCEITRRGDVPLIISCILL
jgi:phosphopantetheinyl transferase